MKLVTKVIWEKPTSLKKAIARARCALRGSKTATETVRDGLAHGACGVYRRYTAAILM